MNHVLDVLLLLLVAVVGVWLFVRNRPNNVAQRRHDKFHARFQAAKDPADQVRYASDYLHEVARTNDVAKSAAIAVELFALASKHNGVAFRPPGKQVARPAEVV
jgi:hypothetical protein